MIVSGRLDWDGLCVDQTFDFTASKDGGCLLVVVWPFYCGGRLTRDRAYISLINKKLCLEIRTSIRIDSTVQAKKYQLNENRTRTTTPKTHYCSQGTIINNLRNFPVIKHPSNHAGYGQQIYDDIYTPGGFAIK